MLPAAVGVLSHSLVREAFVFMYADIATARMSPAAFSPPATFVRPSSKRQHSCSYPRMSLTTGPGPTPSAVPQDNPPPKQSLDWRAFRAHLVAASRLNVPSLHHSHPSLSPRPARWAHRLSTVEVGACLVAKPRYTWPPAFAHLRNAIVLITDVTASGISGLLLTRPTRFKVAQHCSVLGRVGAMFGSNIVHLGGDCSTGTLEVLHQFAPSECAGATEIVPGIFRGGFNASRQLVGVGGAVADDFHFFVAYSKWTWEQYHAEMDRGAWELASCSPSVLLGDSLECSDGGAGIWDDVTRLLPSKR